jgi:cytoskeletal protein CcmA (bactofilin family)
MAAETEQTVEDKPVSPPVLATSGPILPYLLRVANEAHAIKPNEDIKPHEQVEPGTLIIGRGISFTGEITACNRLVVAGMVEASLQHCREVLVSDTGCFKGEARAEDAEISGRVEGSLIIRKRLLIRAGGQVSGNTIYGQIEIECGGRINGETEAREGVQEW